VLRRNAAQLPDEQKVRHADYVIDNAGTIEETAQQVESIWAELRKGS